MKRKSLSFVILFLSICSSGISQNYYKGKKTVKADTITYEIIEVCDGYLIGLKNASNVLFEECQYNTETHECYTYDEMSVLWPPWEQFRNIVAPILNPENVTSGIKINIIMALDPVTGIVREVEYDLWPGQNAKVLSIPPERFEELEKRLVGGDFGFTVPDEFRVANYIKGMYLYEF